MHCDNEIDYALHVLIQSWDEDNEESVVRDDTMTPASTNLTKAQGCSEECNGELARERSLEMKVEVSRCITTKQENERDS